MKGLFHMHISMIDLLLLFQCKEKKTQFEWEKKKKKCLKLIYLLWFNFHSQCLPADFVQVQGEGYIE